MCYEKEIPSLRHSDTAVDNCARLDIAVALLIGILLFRRVKAVVMVLANNDAGDLRLDCILEDLCASSPDCRYLLA